MNSSSEVALRSRRTLVLRNHLHRPLATALPISFKVSWPALDKVERVWLLPLNSKASLACPRICKRKGLQVSASRQARLTTRSRTDSLKARD